MRIISAKIIFHSSSYILMAIKFIEFTVSVGWCAQVFSADGRHLYDIGGSGAGAMTARGTYSGVCMDSSGRYLATRTEKGRCVVQVFDSDGRWMFDVDSHDDRLRRPSGIDVDCDGFVYVADLGNDCIKKFPYM